MTVSPGLQPARVVEKRGTGWSGYKTHLGETASDPALDDPETGRAEHPNLVTACATTHAAVASYLEERRAAQSSRAVGRCDRTETPYWLRHR